MIRDKVKTKHSFVSSINKYKKNRSKENLQKTFDNKKKMLLKFFVLLTVSLLANAYKDPLTVPGRTTLIHLFEWKWADIAAECERFLAPKGYAGVQVSPPNEHLLANNPYRPWFIIVLKEKI